MQKEAFTDTLDMALVISETEYSKRNAMVPDCKILRFLNSENNRAVTTHHIYQLNINGYPKTFFKTDVCTV